MKIYTLLLLPVIYSLLSVTLFTPTVEAGMFRAPAWTKQFRTYLARMSLTMQRFRPKPKLPPSKQGSNTGNGQQAMSVAAVGSTSVVPLLIPSRTINLTDTQPPQPTIPAAPSAPTPEPMQPPAVQPNEVTQVDRAITVQRPTPPTRKQSDTSNPSDTASVSTVVDPASFSLHSSPGAKVARVRSCVTDKKTLMRFQNMYQRYYGQLTREERRFAGIGRLLEVEDRLHQHGYGCLVFEHPRMVHSVEDFLPLADQRRSRQGSSQSKLYFIKHAYSVIFTLHKHGLTLYSPKSSRLNDASYAGLYVDASDDRRPKLVVSSLDILEERAHTVARCNEVLQDQQHMEQHLSAQFNLQLNFLNQQLNRSFNGLLKFIHPDKRQGEFDQQKERYFRLDSIIRMSSCRPQRKPVSSMPAL